MRSLPFRRIIEAPDFWRLWYVGLVVATVRWLETVVVGIVVYQRTDSAFLVSMMTMLRLLPMGLFGVFLGALAERFDRGRTLFAVVLMMSGTSAVLAVLDQAGQLEVWHFAVASFINGCGWSTDNPVRRVMMGEVVGRDKVGTAMSLDVGASNATRMIGPAVGGFLLAGTGIHGAFILSVLMYGTALLAILTIRARIPRAAGSNAVLARIGEGLALVRGDRRLIGVLVVTVIYNLFAWPFTSMIPVIGRDRLHLGPEGVGLLATMDGIGAFVGAMLLALWLTPRWYGRAYIGGVVCYLITVVIFALVQSPALAAAALLLTGLGGAGFGTMQATLVYLAAPVEMRSRILGVLTVCIGTGPIGFVWLGWLADHIGAHNATAVTGILGLVAMAATWRWWKDI
ncbi:MFS transporter [Bradyrhizobium roseum]|uniref:MFS transporter n=1 Tax=Bradyrhizobium roseum TaxID=3056648 RepID=UPI00262F0A76|nr:MFS transporter [Bradyrhizobium roseus]WKA27401.1 MFS transporter [Bradyrhizobium roseus]